MITIELPGNKTIYAKYLVLDYNGTIAIDGYLIPDIEKVLISLSQKINIYVITSNTFGTAVENLKNINCQYLIITGKNHQRQKLQFIKKLGPRKTIAIGNGLNDAKMLHKAALGIAIIQKEGAAPKAIMKADILCNNIFDALDLLINPIRITATIRK